MSLILAYQNRGLTRDLVITDADGDPIIPGANDTLRIIIGHESKLGTNNVDAELTFTSAAATANGSSITKGIVPLGLNRMRLDAQDLDFPAGTYTLFFSLIDNADAGDEKTISRQVFILEET